MLVGVKAWALSHLLVNGDLGLNVGVRWSACLGRLRSHCPEGRGDTGAPPVGWSINDLLVVGLGTAAYVAMFWLHDS